VTTPAVAAFVDAVRRHDLPGLHAAIDWYETGQRRVRDAAAEIDGEVEPGVVDEVVRRGLDESRRAADDQDLVTPYLGSLVDRLGGVRRTRSASDAEVERVSGSGADAGAEGRAVFVVEGDDALLVASPADGGRVVVLGWLDPRPD
jgi:hypothetical protein